MDFVHPIAAVIPGAQGQVLAVLAQTSAELNLRTLARLADVSPAQVSRILPGLVELGLVERREVPPASQFRLVATHVAARLIVALAAVGDAAVIEMGVAAQSLEIMPVSVIIFGSFARGEARADSDLDVVFVRPDGVHEHDEQWGAAVEAWRRAVRSITGNRVEVLEVSEREVAQELEADRDLWRAIRRDGRVVFGLSVEQLTRMHIA